LARLFGARRAGGLVGDVVGCVMRLRHLPSRWRLGIDWFALWGLKFGGDAVASGGVLAGEIPIYDIKERSKYLLL